jgi:hypothetical protein
MTINGAYADSSGNARNSKKLQGKDSTALLAYTKALITGIPALPSSVQGDLLYASGTNTWAKLAKNTSASRYLSNTGTTNNPAWAQVNLSNGVTGTLSSTKGGTGQTSWGIYCNSSISYTLPDMSYLNINYPGRRNGLGAKLDVYRNLGDWTASFRQDDITGGNMVLMMLADPLTSGNSLISFTDTLGNAFGSIAMDAAGGVAYNVTSDSILKHNIKDTKLSLNTLMSIKVRDFNWKRDKLNKTCTGFIAQELYKVYPSAVYKPKDSKSNWQVNFQNLIPLLVKSIQDQQAEITDLTKRIEKLEKLIK